MNKKISALDIDALAKEFGLPKSRVKAVVLVEGSGSGFSASTGKILIQFEAQHFKRCKIKNGVDVQSKEWEAFEEASKINSNEAMMATSWGAGQIMGFNHKAAGYATVEAMINEFKISEYYQIRGMLNFIKYTPKMFNALLVGDWATFARYYNGKAYKKFNYDTRLAEADKKASSIK